MPPSNESLTLPTALYVVFGGACAAFFSWVAGRANKHAEWRRTHSDAATAAEITAEAEERHNFRLAQQGLIDALRTRVKDSEDDRARLWVEFGQIRASLAQTQDDLRVAWAKVDDADLLHKADALRISSLEMENLVLQRENMTLRDRVTTLEHKVNGDG